MPTNSEQMDTPEAWESFLQRYARQAVITAEIDDWEWEGSSDSFSGAPESLISQVEAKLQVTFPKTLRSFYQVSNGWPADEWQPEITSVENLRWLKDAEPYLHQLAILSEQTPGPYYDDPNDERLKEYRYEHGTRVARSLTQSVNENDNGTILVDPFTQSDEWPCGTWGHWIPGMAWDYESFSQYMMSRLQSLIDIAKDG